MFAIAQSRGSLICTFLVESVLASEVTVRWEAQHSCRLRRHTSSGDSLSSSPQPFTRLACKPYYLNGRSQLTCDLELSRCKTLFHCKMTIKKGHFSLVIAHRVDRILDGKPERRLQRCLSVCMMIPDQTDPVLHLMTPTKTPGNNTEILLCQNCGENIPLNTRRDSFPVDVKCLACGTLHRAIRKKSGDIEFVQVSHGADPWDLHSANRVGKS